MSVDPIYKYVILDKTCINDNIIFFFNPLDHITVKSNVPPNVRIVATNIISDKSAFYIQINCSTIFDPDYCSIKLTDDGNVQIIIHKCLYANKHIVCNIETEVHGVVYAFYCALY